jgi:septal ring factor EnvC (AmiA/AmiB activator)
VALSSALSSLPGLLDSAKKEREKDARLVMAGKRKEESLRKLLDKEKDEREKLRRENEGLKERIRCVSAALYLSDILPCGGKR